MIYLHKTLPFLLSPLMLTIMLVADFLFESLEGRNLKTQAQDAEAADAIVVLGSMMVHVNGASGSEPEWDDADRFFAGVDLYQAGKAPRLIFTGGVFITGSEESPF